MKRTPTFQGSTASSSSAFSILALFTSSSFLKSLAAFGCNKILKTKKSKLPLKESAFPASSWPLGFAYVEGRRTCVFSQVPHLEPSKVTLNDSVHKQLEGFAVFRQRRGASNTFSFFGKQSTMQRASIYLNKACKSWADVKRALFPPIW